MSETLSGGLFGLAAELSPGPLLVLVIQQTLRYGTSEGLKVAGELCSLTRSLLPWPSSR